MTKTEEEKQLKRLREMVSAVLASGAYSLKEEQRQLERITAQLKNANSALEAGVISQAELNEIELMIQREQNVVRRSWKIRREIANRLISDLEAELDALEGESS